MKKVLMVLMICCLIVISGCGKKKEKGSDVEKFEIEAKFGKLYFELPKDSGYELKTDTNKGTLKHKDNDSTIEIYILDTSKSSIIMSEKDFSMSAYTSYKEIDVNGHSAYKIKKSNNFSVQYGILLDEYDKDHNKNYGVKILVSKNSLKLDEFDPSEFVESSTFKTFLDSLKFEAGKKVESDNKVMKNYGEFEGRTDGLSDNDGLLFIKKFDSPNVDIYKADQRNNNVGIDNYLWYTNEKRQYESSSIEVRIFPKKETYNSIDEYKDKKGNQYTWGKTTIAGVEYDTYVFANSSKPSKFSEYVSGAFMVGNHVVEFSYNMYAEIPDQNLGETFFKQIVDSIEYSKDFK